MVFDIISARISMNHYQILCTFQGNGAIDVYKKQPNTQLSFDDFNQPVRLTMNPENRWVKKAELIPWIDLEKRSISLHFPKQNGRCLPKSFRMAFGVLLIQRSMGTQMKRRFSKSKRTPTCSSSLVCLAIKRIAI